MYGCTYHSINVKKYWGEIKNSFVDKTIVISTCEHKSSLGVAKRCQAWAFALAFIFADGGPLAFAFETALGRGFPCSIARVAMDKASAHGTPCDHALAAASSTMERLAR